MVTLGLSFIFEEIMMFFSNTKVKKYVLALVATTVFFWAVVLPAHFHHKKHFIGACACKYLFLSQVEKANNAVTTISENTAWNSDGKTQCPYCILSSMFGIGIAVDSNTDTVGSLGQKLFCSEMVSYRFYVLNYIKARAPPVVNIV